MRLFEGHNALHSPHDAVDGVPLLLRDVVGYSLARLGIRGDLELDKTGSPPGAPMAQPPDVLSFHHVKIFDEAGGRRGDAASSSAPGCC